MKQNKISILFLALALIGLVSCGNTKSNEESTDAVSTESESKVAPSVVLNANLASEEELTQIGLTADMIQQVMENRPFITMNDFDALVPADMNKEELYKSIFVPFNLNTTAEGDFKMIPGVGDKMAHEFEEYRPYTSIAQFRREIGKYVDDSEVKRYESYVFVPVELNSASEDDIKALPGLSDKMVHEFLEYRPYDNMDRFYKEIGKYVDEKELDRLARLVYINNQ
jgi:DNA uptake protein ComE-like DNA-binding protein